MARVEPPARFLPGAGERVAIAAGSGRLPVEIAEALAGTGHEPFIVLIEGEADPAEPAFIRHEHWIMPIERVGELASRLRRAGVTHFVLAGGVERRPRVRAMRPGFGLLRMVPRVMAALARGDDNLLRAIVNYYESIGIKVVGAHQIQPDLLAPRGTLTRRAPGRRDQADIRAAAIAARAIGSLDIGQGAVAIGGRAVALEGIEGTDGLLERVREFRSHGRLSGRAGGVLVKCAKPQQEMRADLPTIGPETVDLAHEAGLSGIGIEADRSIVLDMGAVVARADQLGLFVVGLVERDWLE